MTSTLITLPLGKVMMVMIEKDKDKDKDLFIGPQEFVVGYSKAPEQPQSSARPICHSHAMTNTGSEPATIRTAAKELAALRIDSFNHSDLLPLRYSIYIGLIQC